MIDELLQDRSALYVSGAMTERERVDFELILEFHDEVRRFVTELQEVGSAMLIASISASGPQPSPKIKAQILQAIADRPQQTHAEGFVLTGPDRLVQWVNPAFVEMCGYTLDELRGKKLGPILQGEKTDPAAVSRIRSALHENRPCHEKVVNYRKNGEPYWVDIEITPILDDAGVPLWIVAREQELDLPLAA